LYYRWSKDFLEAGKKQLAGDTVREATSDEVKDLRSENREPATGHPRGFDITSLLGLARETRSECPIPDATQEMYDRDMAACRYGIEPFDSAAYSSAIADRQRSHRAWKACMVTRGWDTTVGNRSSPSWRPPYRPSKAGKG
jgi:hypothetical protein